MSTAENSPLSINESDLHAHLQDRMAQRGITFVDMQQTLAAGWPATDCRPGTLGKVFVFSYKAEWEGRFYDEKEVMVKDDRIILLTAKARYGQRFPSGEMTDENRV